MTHRFGQTDWMARESPVNELTVYAIEKGGKVRKSDLRRFTPAPLAAIHFTNYSRAAEGAAKTGGAVVKSCATSAT